jgi:hypothetical protein
VLSIGALAARFVQKYRAQLFPDAPMVLTAVEQRLVNHAGLTDNDTVISVYNDFSGFFGSILQVLPDTQTIAVFLGASPLEKFWLDEARKEAKSFENRVASKAPNYFAGSSIVAPYVGENLLHLSKVRRPRFEH